MNWPLFRRFGEPGFLERSRLNIVEFLKQYLMGFDDQIRYFLADVGFHGQSDSRKSSVSTLFKVLTYATRSASVLTSVEATTMRSASSGLAGSRRETGTPPSTPFLASFSMTSTALPGTRMVNSLKKVSLSTVTPLTLASALASATALAWLMRASRRKPASPSSVMWMVKANTHKPELVQMLEVAFSRRMCCSRVESVSTNPRRPSLSTVSPASRPGICRTYF